jgi:hypothetical protein
LTVDDYTPQGGPTSERNTAHEANSLRVGSLVGFAAALVAVGILVEAVVALLVSGLSREEKTLQALAPPRFAGDAGGFPEPRLQSDPADEFVKMRAEELSRLNGYGWVDLSAGIAHIPIDRAIDILARSGLPGPAGGGAPAAAEATRAPKEAARADSKKGQKP